MVIFTTNPAVLVPMLMIWALEIYLFLTALRLITGNLSGDWARRTCAALQPITDPAPQAVGRWLAARWKDRVPGWLPHMLVIAVAVLGQQVLAALILRMSQP